MNAFAVSCCGSNGNRPRSGKNQSERQGSVSRRPAVIGAVPLYFLLRAGNQLRAALPALHGAGIHENGHAEVMHPQSVAENLRTAAETAAKELAEREIEVAMLRERCDSLVTALAFANERTNALLDGRTQSELSRTAARFETALTAAKCRAVRAERDSEVLAEEMKKLERKLADQYSDSVKTNAAIAAVTLALISFWVHNFATDFLTMS